MAITGVKISEFNDSKAETGVMENASNIFLACYKKSTDSNVNTQVCLNDIKNYIDGKTGGNYYEVKTDVYINDKETIIGTMPPVTPPGVTPTAHNEVNTIINNESITLRNGSYIAGSPQSPSTVTTYIKKGEFEILTRYIGSGKNGNKNKSIDLNTYVNDPKHPNITITGADSTTGKEEIVEIYPYKITSKIGNSEYASLYFTNDNTSFNNLRPTAMRGSILGPIYGSPLHTIWNDAATNVDGDDTPTLWPAANRGGIYLGTKGASFKEAHPNGRFLWVYDGSSWYFVPLQKCGTSSWS